ncbi:MAG TPA: hypothetical protein VGV18_09275 [Verrucomicrobiae bacterium]|nr:hypothetical protein [Verrucomicrobiae bacterium]
MITIDPARFEHSAFHFLRSPQNQCDQPPWFMSHWVVDGPWVKVHGPKTQKFYCEAMQ